MQFFVPLIAYSVSCEFHTASMRSTFFLATTETIQDPDHHVFQLADVNGMYYSAVFFASPPFMVYCTSPQLTL